MSALLNPRPARARSRWLIPVVVLGALASLLWDTRRPPPGPANVSPPAASPAGPGRIVAQPPSKLALAGLPDNVDLEGLPEFFAVYADAAEWRDNRTLFSYWHPGAKAYAYFFEATRGPGGFHFRAIPEPPVDEQDFYWDESLGDEAPIRFYRSRARDEEAALRPVSPGIKLVEPGPPGRIKIEEKPAVPLRPDVAPVPGVPAVQPPETHPKP